MSTDVDSEEPIPITEIDTKRERPIRLVMPPILFVIHTTGDTDEEAVNAYYQRGGIGPHVMINYEGVIRRYTSEDRSAAHAGFSSKHRELYESGEWRKYVERDSGGIKSYTKLASDYSGYKLWDERWPGKKSPLDLPSGGYPNAVSIGVELLAPRKLGPEIFTDAQYASCAAYLKEQGALHRIILNRQQVLGHYDVNPIARASKYGDRDPGIRFNWDRLLRDCQ